MQTRDVNRRGEQEVQTGGCRGCGLMEANKSERLTVKYPPETKIIAEGWATGLEVRAPHSRQTTAAVLIASTFPDNPEIGRKAGTARALATLAGLANACDKTRRVAAPRE